MSATKYLSNQRAARVFLGAACIAAAADKAQAQEGLLLEPEPMIGYALDWLAPGGQATSIPGQIEVYSLGCGSCLEKLSDISQGYAPAPALFVLASFQKRDRDVTLPLMRFGSLMRTRKTGVRTSSICFASSPRTRTTT